jgi:hypothetical protein
MPSTLIGIFHGDW